MLNVSNNQFELTFSLEIPKIRSFCNFKVKKIAKNAVKIFLASTLADTTCLNIKNAANERRDQIY